MARKAPKQSTPVVPQEQLDEIERQRIAQKQAYDNEQQLIRQQSQEQTSALQAMLNVYQRQAQDLETTRQQQAQEQQQLLKTQEEQAKLIEADRLSSQARMSDQQKVERRVADRTRRVISQRSEARKSSQSRVFGAPNEGSYSTTSQPTMFRRRQQLTN